MTAVFISADQAERLSATPIWLDCRFRLGEPEAGRELYRSGHIQGARYADLDQDLADLGNGAGRHPLPDPADFIQRCQDWEIRPGGPPVVVYDDVSGAMAARAWWMLRWVGVREVFILDGGLQAYTSGGGVLCRDGNAKAPGVGQGTGSAANSLGAGEWTHGHMPTIGVAELQQRLGHGGDSTASPGWLLLDARAPERFNGEVEPIDAVAGHVPGAQNCPFSVSLADGRLGEPGALHQAWQQTLGQRTPDQVIHMCGSGVTACFNLACMEHLGLGGSALYVGSWSEWITDPARPVG